MVARPGTYQASNAAGELAPEEYGRTDLKQFYSGVATALNIEPVPQGGSKLSMRTRHLGRIRGALASIGLSSSSLPTGSYDAAAVLAAATFASAALSCVTLDNWAASQALGAIVQVEYLVGASWVALSDPFTVGIDLGTITAARPPRQAVTTTQVRVRMISAPPSATSFTAGGISVRAETSAIAEARVRPFTFALDQTYIAVLMNGIVDFYRDGVWVGASIMGFSSAQLAELDTPQRLDTMLLFHRNGGPQRILRDGADNKWLLLAMPLENVPVVDLGGDYTNQVADVWQMYVRYPTADIDSDVINGQDMSVSMTVNGEATAPVQSSHTPVDWNAFAADVKTAIEATTTVEVGITVTIGPSGAGAQVLTITFGGAGNIGKTNTFAAEVINTAEAAATVAHSVVGDPGGEPLISVARGFPACASFYQDRLIQGGFNSKRSAWLASVTGEYFDLNVKLQAPSGALLANLDTDGAEQLQRIVRDTYLLFFTSDGEYFVSDRTIDRTKPPNIVNSSRYGSAPDLPVLSNEGEVIFASRNKSVLYAGTYDEVTTRYVFSPISLLASHIVNGMVDMAIQRPSGLANAARLWMPRSDGSVTLGIMLRNQDITAFVRWQTPGSVTSAAVDGKNVPHLIVRRMVGGVAELHLERAEDGLIFDDVVAQTFAPARQVITGLGVHEGAVVWARADGYVVGPFTVAGGQVDIGFAAASVEVGRWTPPRCVTLPLPSEVAERVVLRRPKRVHTVRLDLVDTTSVAVGANNRPPRDVALASVTDLVDTPQQPIDDTIVVTGLTGFSDAGQVEITQVTPGQLGWRGITIEART